MKNLLRCDCGFEVRADNDDDLVALAQAHARDVLDMELSAEQVLRLAARAEPQPSTDR
jgi:predicted small metal-binding protein